MSNKKLNFIIFGSIPPPHGGVTISVQNLILSLKSLQIDAQLISKRHLFQFKKFDIAHIHYSKRWKVLIAILLGKFLAKKTLVTKHGAEFYPQEILGDKMILNLSDGMIVLNGKVYHRCSSKKHLIQLSPVFKEGILHTQNKQASYFEKENDCKYLLLYASGKVYIDNKEVYGVQFILDTLPYLEKNIKVIILDPSGEYKEEITKNLSSQIIYIAQSVDFKDLLSHVDLYIRPTTSDGNSVATLEALSVGTPVLASDVVERNSHITTYKLFNQEEFIEKLHKLLNQSSQNNSFELESIQKYINFCLKILKKK